MIRRRRIAHLFDRLGFWVFGPNLLVRDALTQAKVDQGIEEWARMNP